MTKKRLILIGSLIVLGILLAYMFSSGGVKLANNETKENTVNTVPESVLKKQPSLIEDKTGIEQNTVDIYIPNEQDIKSTIEPLIAFDTNNQTYEEWHDFASNKIAFSIQDFPEESILGITPSPERWNEGWKREFVPSNTTLLGSYRGQGGVKIYDWVVSGFQTLYSPDGASFIGAQNDVTVSIACGGESMAECYVYAYFGVWPINFEEESS